MAVVPITARVLTGLRGLEDLRCSCGAETDLAQPDDQNAAELVGTCPGCGVCTIYREVLEPWLAAQAYELPVFELQDPEPLEPPRRRIA
jgi:hypothetical protein